MGPEVGSILTNSIHAGLIMIFEDLDRSTCQDSEGIWLHWDLSEDQPAFADFARVVIQLQRTEPVFQRRKFFMGRPIQGEGILDLSWFEPSRRGIDQGSMELRLYPLPRSAMDRRSDRGSRQER